MSGNHFPWGGFSASPYAQILADFPQRVGKRFGGWRKRAFGAPCNADWTRDIGHRQRHDSHRARCSLSKSRLKRQHSKVVSLAKESAIGQQRYRLHSMTRRHQSRLAKGDIELPPETYIWWRQDPVPAAEIFQTWLREAHQRMIGAADNAGVII